MLPLLLVPLILLCPSLLAERIDCSIEDTCFGEPYECDPNKDCRNLFHFDRQGSLHLFLRNFTQLNRYAAFAVRHHPDEVIEYFMCVPRLGLRVRALTELGGLVLVTETNLTGSINRLGDNFFRCIFNVSELPKRFQREQMFFVSRGEYRDIMIIFDGEQLFNLNEFGNEMEYYDMEEVIPVAHHIGSPHHRAMSNKDTNHHSSSNTEDDDSTRSSRQYRYAAGDESVLRNHHVEDEKDYDELVMKREQNRKPRYFTKEDSDEDDSEDSDYSEDEENVESRVPRKRHVDIEIQSRETFKRDSEGEDYKNMDEAYDDWNNIHKNQKWTLLLIFSLIRFLF